MKTANLKTIGKTLGASLLLVSALAGASPADARMGTGVGNGGNGTREQYLEKLRGELGMSVAGPESQVPELSQWCNRASNVLRRELKRASTLAATSRFEASWQVLQDALYAVAQSIEVDPETAAPMTKLLVDRGLLLSSAIDEAVGSSGRQQLVSKLNFLFEYVQFVIDMESYVDRPWYLPYHYQYNRCNRGCGNFRFEEFQRAYLDYARQQLEFVLRSLTQVVNIGYSYDVRPIGDPRVFLKAAELVAGFVATDVSSNLFAYAQSCTVLKLQDLAASLSAFNSFGDRTEFPNYRLALNAAHSELSSASAMLAEGVAGGCR